MAEKTRRLTAPWPFLWSIVPKRGLVRNLEPKRKKTPRLKKVKPANQWTQEALL